MHCPHVIIGAVEGHIKFRITGEGSNFKMSNIALTIKFQNEPMPKAAYVPQDDAYNFLAKRAAQWQAAQGLWGKRSDPQFQYPAFQYQQQA
jgi:hypothetical protein